VDPKSTGGIDVTACPTYSFLKNFTVSILTFRSLSYLKLIFVYGLRNVLISFSFSVLRTTLLASILTFTYFPFRQWRRVPSSPQLLADLPLAVVVQSVTSASLCPVNCSTPGFPVFHYLPEFAQTHIHWVSVAIRLSHPLSPPSPLALNLSQHQGLFQWISSSHQVPKYWIFSCTQYASKFGKLSSGHRTGKGQFSFQSQRKAMPKNAQTTKQLHSSHTLVK